MLFFAILFGFFNGLGSSNDLLINLEGNESELIPIIEVVFGATSAILIIILTLLSVITLLRKIPKIDKKTWILGFSIIIIGLSLPLMFDQIFY